MQCISPLGIVSAHHRTPLLKTRKLLIRIEAVRELWMHIMTIYVHCFETQDTTHTSGEPPCHSLIHVYRRMQYRRAKTSESWRSRVRQGRKRRRKDRTMGGAHSTRRYRLASVKNHWMTYKGTHREMNSNRWAEHCSRARRNVII